MKKVLNISIVISLITLVYTICGIYFTFQHNDEPDRIADKTSFCESKGYRDTNECSQKFDEVSAKMVENRIVLFILALCTVFIISIVNPLCGYCGAKVRKQKCVWEGRKVTSSQFSCCQKIMIWFFNLMKRGVIQLILAASRSAIVLAVWYS